MLIFYWMQKCSMTRSAAAVVYGVHLLTIYRMIVQIVCEYKNPRSRNDPRDYCV